MAEVVDKLPRRRGHIGKYPWREWLDGRIWKLTMGIDYTDYSALRSSAYHTARRMGLRVEVTRCGDEIYVQAVGKRPDCRSGAPHGDGCGCAACRIRNFDE